MIYSEATRRAAAASPTRPASPVGETQAGKGALPDSITRRRSAAIGVTGTRAAESPGARRRSGDRRRIAAERLHHRVEDGVPARARAVRHDQRRGARRRQSTPRSPLVGDARAALDDLTADARRLSRRRRVSTPRSAPRRRTGSAEVDRICADPASRCASQGELTRRRSSACSGRARPDGRHRVRGRQSAGRSAQAVADARSEGLSPGVRLFLHGLRDRRRARRQDGGARSPRSTCWSATGRT